MTALKQTGHSENVDSEDQFGAVEWAPTGRMRRKLLTAETVAYFCELLLPTLYEMVRQDRIGGVIRLERLIRFDPDRLEAWLAAGGQALPGGWRREEQ